jgi:hypothetical protein
MALIEIPTRSDLKAYEMQLELDGVTYTLGFRFNERLGLWVMDIGDANENDLLNGIPLLTNVPLTDDYVAEGLPPGRFICEDTTGQSRDAGAEDLGNGVRLLYEEAS